MKITKINNILTEDVNDDIIDIKNDSIAEIADQVQTDVEEISDGELTVSDTEATKQAQEIKTIGNEIKAENAINLDLANQSLGTKNALTETLDLCLAESLTKRRRFKKTDGTVAVGSNLLVEGLPGSGKTAIVYDWAKGAGVTLVYVNAKDRDLEAFLNGFTVRDDENKKRVTKAYSDALSILDKKENCVLFLDEFNRQTKEEIRASILTLINEKYVQGDDNPETPGRHYFPNLLFAIACINPAVGRTDRGAAKLNQAEYSRFEHSLTGKNSFDSKPEVALNYFDKYYDRAIELLDPEDEFYKADLEAALRTQDLGKYIVSYPNFSFDTRDDLDELDQTNATMLNQRHLSNGLEDSDGDVEAFRRWVNTDSNLLEKDVDMLNDILDHYTIPKLEDLLKAKQIKLADTLKNTEDEDAQITDNSDIEDDDDDAIWGNSGDGTKKVAASSMTAIDRITDFMNNI